MLMYANIISPLGCHCSLMFYLKIKGAARVWIDLISFVKYYDDPVNIPYPLLKTWCIFFKLSTIHWSQISLQSASQL